MSIAEQMRAYREAEGLSQPAAAARAGISQSYWEKLEVGQMQNPSYAILVKIAATLEVSIPHLLREATRETASI